MQTTPNGLPYPELADPVASWPSTIAAMAEQLDPPAGWQAVPLAAGFTGTLQYRQSGVVVVLRGAVTGNFPVGQVAVTAAVPAGLVWTGAAQLQTGVAAFGSALFGAVMVNAIGQVIVMNQSGAARTLANFHLTWALD